MQDKLFLNDKFIEQLRSYIRFKDWSDGREREVQFSVTFRREDFFIKDHVLGGKLLVPAVIFMELWARIAGSLLKEGSPVVLQNIIFVKPALVDKDRLEMNCVCTGSSNSIKFRVETCQGVHIQGKIVLDRATGTEEKNILPDDWKKRCNVKIESGDFYKHFEKTGYQYGPSFKNMQYVSMGESEALAFIKADGKTEEQQKEFMLYPGILEGGLQATGFFLEKDVKEYLSFVPFQVGQLQVFRKLPRECYVHIRKIDTKDGRSKKAELFFLTGNGEIAASIKDYYVMPLKKPNPPVSLIVKPEEKPVDIAIIGISGRMPQSDNLEIFFKNLMDNKDMITTIPDWRFQWKEYYGDPFREPNKTNSKWGGFLTDIKSFDAGFFRISREEADFMDPQQRLLLEVIWELFEDAGYKPSAYFGSKTGVYVGVSNQEYLESMNDRVENSEIMLGNNSPMIANRISYQFDLKGPSEPVDTLCSSSLTALYHAVNDLLRGNCNQAVVGGVNIILTPRLFISYANTGMLSRTGSCKTFDKNADGFVRGEGIGAVLLKPLHKAMEDKDKIYAVIKGIAAAHQGRSHTLVSPSTVSQAEVIEHAICQAGIDPNTITYIETHGTGTPIGDAVEINGLKAAFESVGRLKNVTVKERVCRLGAIKSNIGHLESAAGIAGLLKVLLAMKYEMLPGNLHYKEQNPQINLEGSPFLINAASGKWTCLLNKEGEKIPRRAGISSFGAGGVNAHAVLEEFVNKLERVEAQENMIFVLSSATVDGVRLYAKRVMDYLKETQEPIENIIYTAQTGREALQVRIACLFRTKQELLNNLAEYLMGGISPVREQVCQIDNWKPNRQKTDIRELVLAKDYEAIMNRYLSGDDIDWMKLYDKACYTKTDFPKYNFEKTEYWHTKNAVMSQGDIQENKETCKEPEEPKEEEEELNTLLYCHEEWISEVKAIKGNTYENTILLCGREKEAKYLQKVVGEEIPCYPIIPETYNTNVKEIGASQKEGEEEYFEMIWKSICERKVKPDCVVVGFGLSAILNGSGIFMNLFHIMKRFMRYFYSRHIHFIYIYCRSGDLNEVFHSAAAAFMKSVLLENKNFCGAVIQADNRDTGLEIIKKELYKNAKNIFFQKIRYDGRNGRMVEHLRSAAGQSSTGRKLSIRKNGVYLISGGLGGIGRILTEFLLKEFQCKVIVLGRKEELEISPQYLESLRNCGGAFLYRKVDVSMQQEMEKVLFQTKERFHEINGIFHLAGCMKDKQLLRKEPEEAASVLNPKINGVMNLDYLTRGEPLDFFVLFSSITAILGQAGQSDYAYANAFLDSFAVFRNKQVEEGRRKGLTSSINWPYWSDGGMVISEKNKNTLKEKTGLGDITSKTALEVLTKVIEAGQPRLTLLAGDKKKLVDLFLTGEVKEKTGNPEIVN